MDAQALSRRIDMSLVCLRSRRLIRSRYLGFENKLTDPSSPFSFFHLLLERHSRMEADHAPLQHKMGPKHNRRCRRYRLRRSRKGLETTQTSACHQPGFLAASGDSAPPLSAARVDFSRTGGCSHHPGHISRESDVARERRIFGGLEDDLGDVDLDLRGPMLDVVLALFSNVDYDDAALG